MQDKYRVSRDPLNKSPKQKVDNHSKSGDTLWSWEKCIGMKKRWDRSRAKILSPLGGILRMCKVEAL